MSERNNNKLLSPDRQQFPGASYNKSEVIRDDQNILG